MKKGFTLIELMVTIAVIGLLAAIALPRFTNITKDAEVAQIQANARNIQTAIQVYMVKEDYSIEEFLDSTKKEGLSMQEDANNTNKEFKKMLKYYGKGKLPYIPGTDRNNPYFIEEEPTDEKVKDGKFYNEYFKNGWYITKKGEVFPIVDKEKYGIECNEFI